MRPGVGFEGAAAPPTELHHHRQATHSAWHSPVPYLFGGLAAMLGLIAFALLILACSYWKLSSYLEGDGDAESAGEGEGKPADPVAKPPAAYFEERIVVIMAGDEKPTFLATPISSRASSFGDNNKSSDVASHETQDAKNHDSPAQTQATVQEQAQSHEQNQEQ